MMIQRTVYAVVMRSTFIPGVVEVTLNLKVS